VKATFHISAQGHRLPTLYEAIRSPAPRLPIFIDRGAPRQSPQRPCRNAPQDHRDDLKIVALAPLAEASPTPSRSFVPRFWLILHLPSSRVMAKRQPTMPRNMISMKVSGASASAHGLASLCSC
jgi:hypothetical protein